MLEIGTTYRESENEDELLIKPHRIEALERAKQHSPAKERRSIKLSPKKPTGEFYNPALMTH